MEKLIPILERATVALERIASSLTGDDQIVDYNDSLIGEVGQLKEAFWSEEDEGRHSIAESLDAIGRVYVNR